MRRSACWFILAVFLTLGTALVGSAQEGVTAIETPFRMAQVRMSPDGSLLALFETRAILGDDVMPGNERVLLADLPSGQIVGALEGLGDFVEDADFSPDGNQILTLESDGTVRLWDLATRSKITHYPMFDLGGRILFLPDGAHFLFRRNGWPSIFQVIRLSDGAIVKQFGRWTGPSTTLRATLAEMPGRFRLSFEAIHSNAAQNILVAASGVGEIAQFDLESGTVNLLFVPETIDQRSLLSVLALDVTADGQRLAFSDSVNDITRVLNISDGTVVAEIPVDAGALAFTPDGARLIWLQNREGVIGAATLGDGDPKISTVLEGLGRVSPRPALFVTPDGTRLVIGSSLAGDEVGSMIYVVPLEP